jgi:hypothetical protein
VAHSSTVKVEAVGFCEMLVTICLTMLHAIASEDVHENLGFRTISFVQTAQWKKVILLSKLLVHRNCISGTLYFWYFYLLLYFHFPMSSHIYIYIYIYKIILAAQMVASQEGLSSMSEWVI